MTVSFVLRPH